jgi:hypothetical protein
MALANQIEFQVDEQYENEKGVFTVISIHRSEMVIRWENGEEIRTDIELQRNIQARRQWEEMNRKAQAAKKSSAANKNAGFPGFMPGDFKHTASGTKWRGRAQLGGEVAALMPADRFNFNSWAFAQKPELHWLDTKHRRSAGAGRGARFFVRLTPAEMIFGFCIPKTTDDYDKAEWDRFVQWAGEAENDQNILKWAEENGMTICDRNRPVAGTLAPTPKGWRCEEGSKVKASDVATFIDQLAESDDIMLEVAKKINKVDAVSQGKAVAEEIAKLFDQLIPMYSAAITR